MASVPKSQYDELKKKYESLEAKLDKVTKKVQQVHQLLKRGDRTEDHGLIGNLDCIIDHLTEGVFKDD